MSFVVSIETNQPVPSVLNEAQIRARVESLPNTTGFLGVKPGNPIFTLWATEADANAYSASVQADSDMASVLQTVQVVSLDSTAFSVTDFYDLTENFPPSNN